MREQDEFITLYLRLRVEEQLEWYFRRAKLMSTRRRMLLSTLYSLLFLTVLNYALPVTLPSSNPFWSVSGIVFPVASLAMATTIGLSSLGRRSSFYQDIYDALEEVYFQGKALSRDSAVGEAEIAGWVERVEDLLSGEEAVGQGDALSADWNPRRGAAAAE